MIKPQELRIGNYVTDEFYKDFKTIIEVDSITKKGINVFIEYDGNYPEMAESWIEPKYAFDKLFGIPLTEEILLKFGFEKREHKSFFKGKELIYFTFTSNKYGFLIWNTIQNQWWVLGKISISQPIYVHQLQNLYFALTNTELIWNGEI